MSYYPSDLEHLKEIVKDRGIKIKVPENIENLISALSSYDYFDEFEKDHLVKICQRQPGSICDKKSLDVIQKMSKSEIINSILYINKTTAELRRIATARKLPQIKGFDREQLLIRLNEYDILDYPKSDLELYRICEMKGTPICMTNKNLTRNQVILAILARQDELYCSMVEQNLKRVYKELSTYQKNISRMTYRQETVQHIIDLYQQYQNNWVGIYQKYVDEGLICDNKVKIQKYLKFKLNPNILNPLKYRQVERPKTRRLQKIPLRSYEPSLEPGGTWQKMIRWLMAILEKEKIKYVCLPKIKSDRDKNKGRKSKAGSKAGQEHHLSQITLFGKNISGSHIKESLDWKLGSPPDYFQIISKKFKAIIPKNQYLKINKLCPKNTRFVIYLLRLIEMFPDNSFGHRNVILVDTKLKTVERFEPHGAFTSIYDNDYVDQFMEMLVSKMDGKGRDKFKYLPPIEYCPFIGPQAKQFADTGYCVTWSTLYLHMRMINPDAPTSEILEYLMNKNPMELKDMIQRYQTMMNKYS